MLRLGEIIEQSELKSNQRSKNTWLSFDADSVGGEGYETMEGLEWH
jgi:hypothetical protein